MDARRLNIGIRSGDERSKALREAMRRAARGDGTPQEPELYFENVEELRQILTEKRLELLLALTRHRPASVRELAGLLERDYKNVSTRKCVKCVPERSNREILWRMCRASKRTGQAALTPPKDQPKQFASRRKLILKPLSTATFSSTNSSRGGFQKNA
jgi:hypothetical protein